MAVKSVTAANLAEHVAEKRSLGHVIATHEQAAQVEAKTTETKPEGKGPVVGATTETVSTAPEPTGTAAETKPVEKQGKKNSVQDRIDELTREKREYEEFAETEYNGRVQAQRRIAELESQIQALSKVEAPKPVEEPEPDPSKYTDQKAFLKDWGEWNRKKAIRDFQAEEEGRRREEEQKRLVAEANARRDASLEAARETFADFDEKLQEAARSAEMQRIPAPSKAVEGLLWESDYHAHILYYFASHPEEVKRINALRPAQAAIALGRLETQFAKADEATTKAPPTATPPPTTKAPPPMPSLTGATETTWDPQQPQDFKAYKQKRLDEIRRARAKH